MRYRLLAACVIAGAADASASYAQTNVQRSAVMPKINILPSAVGWMGQTPGVNPRPIPYPIVNPINPNWPINAFNPGYSGFPINSYGPSTNYYGEVYQPWANANAFAPFNAPVNVNNPFGNAAPYYGFNNPYGLIGNPYNTANFGGNQAIYGIVPNLRR